MNALSARHRVKRLDCITGSPMLSQIWGTDEEHGAGTHRSPIFARPESGAAQRGRIRHRRRQKVASGLANLGRRRPTPSPAADFHTARRARDDAPSPPDPCRSSQRPHRLRITADDYPALVGNLSFSRQPPLAPPRPVDRARSVLHHSRPLRFGGSPRPYAHGARPGPNGFPLPPQGHLPRGLLLHGECRVPLEETLAQGFPWCAHWAGELRRLFEAYVVAKQRDNVLDYDDLLLYWRHAMAEPAVATEIRGCFDHVLVDEYQDTNRLQAEILMALRPDGSGLTIVGDDAQSIYSFRAATVRNILDFPHHFSPPATVIALERNYRSTQPILDAANAVIAGVSERFAKTLYSTKASAERPFLANVEDETLQARYVADSVLDHREAGIALRRQAVLFRTGHHSDLLEIELGRGNIPFVKYGGLRFLEAAHVKDLLAILRWAENPRDAVAGLRVLQLLPGVGPATARA